MRSIGKRRYVIYRFWTFFLLQWFSIRSSKNVALAYFASYLAERKLNKRYMIPKNEEINQQHSIQTNLAYIKKHNKIKKENTMEYNEIKRG